MGGGAPLRSSSRRQDSSASPTDTETKISRLGVRTKRPTGADHPASTDQPALILRFEILPEHFISRTGQREAALDAHIVTGGVFGAAAPASHRIQRH